MQADLLGGFTQRGRDQIAIPGLLATAGE